jgi:hypothetical protein
MRTEDGKEIYFKVINTSSAAIPISLDIAGSFTLRGARLEQIAPPGLSAVNSMTAPDNIRVEEGNVTIDNQLVNFTIPKYGAVIVTVSQDPTVGVDSHDPGETRDYRLYANYPNPFNPTTVISYQLPVTSNVSLEVYNLLGQEVAILFEGVRQAGNYQATFDGSRLASGIYLCRMKANHFVETKKLVLLK